ncbi:ABC transporter ATP-binding protein [Paenibacillus chartarius]|uniref:ABC transporter ATP-binding protein n=1 Tax=Paenibacillus chartarius TaxID=747481 RepID=A0ABV6DQ05_9BACL
MKPAIDVQDVSQVYVAKKKAVLAVEHISFQLLPGEFVSLIGPSGCGKTTLLSMIAGLMAPTRGVVGLFGEPVTGPSPKIGYMLQQDYLFPWRTIVDNAYIGLELRGQLTKERKDYVHHLLEEMGLIGFKDALPAQLSGGMRQRVALVRTLATDPDILLLDEPFSALDYQTKLQLEDLVAETLRDKGKSALLVTHDITEAIAMSDRIFILQPRPGRIRREVEVPADIRAELPFAAREQAHFQELFRDVWSEFEQMTAAGAAMKRREGGEGR